MHLKPRSSQPLWEESLKRSPGGPLLDRKWRKYFFLKIYIFLLSLWFCPTPIPRQSYNGVVAAMGGQAPETPREENSSLQPEKLWSREQGWNVPNSLSSFFSVLVPRGRVSPRRLYDRARELKLRDSVLIWGRGASRSRKVSGRPWGWGSSRKWSQNVGCELLGLGVNSRICGSGQRLGLQGRPLSRSQILLDGTT